MKTFEVLNRRGTTQIEQVLARPAIASLVALASGDMGKRVLDGSALTQLGAPELASLERTKLSPSGLVKLIGAPAAMRLLTEKVGFEPDKQKIDDMGRVVAACGLHPQSSDPRKLSAP